MNTTKKLLCILTAGAALGASAPVFADAFHNRGYDHNRHGAQFRDFDRYGYRAHDRRVHRNYNRRPVVVVQRPYIVEQPVYYSQPAPAANMGMGALIGAAIGGIYDSRQQY